MLYEEKMGIMKVAAINGKFIRKLYRKEHLPVFVLSIIIGIVGGLGAILFRFMISFNRSLFFDVLLPLISFKYAGYNISVFLIPVIGGLIIGPIIYKFAKETKGHGVPEVIEAVHIKGGYIRSRVAIVKILVSSITIGSGGSAGREGPIAQIGAVFGSFIGGLLFKAKKYRRLMVSCGVAAGISATFNAPLGGALFSMEIISTHRGLVNSIPILLSAVIGDVITGIFFGLAPVFNAPVYIFKSLSEIPLFFIVGILFGFLSIVWIKFFYKIEDFFEFIKFPEMLKPALGAAAVGIIGVFFFSYGIMGVGYEDINLVMLGKLSMNMIIILGVLKIIATSFTIGSGGSGGIFAPSLYIGAMFGTTTGLVMNQFFPVIVTEPYSFALIGMGALFAGACRAPLTSLVMIPEMTNNYHLLIPMMIVCSISYFITLFMTKDSMYFTKLVKRGVKIRHEENPLEDIMVRDVMSKDVKTIKPETPVSKFMNLCLKTRHPGFPVTKKGVFLGYAKLYGARSLRSIKNKKIKVKDIMNKEYPTVTEHDNVYHALNLMTRHGLGRIIVVKEVKGKKYVKGVISKTDVIRSYEILIEG